MVWGWPGKVGQTQLQRLGRLKGGGGGGGGGRSFCRVSNDHVHWFQLHSMHAENGSLKCIGDSCSEATLLRWSPGTVFYVLSLTTCHGACQMILL